MTTFLNAITRMLKQAVSNEIEAYKYRKFASFFKEPLTSGERTLLLPFIYFARDKDVRVVYDIGAAEGRFSTAVSKLRNIGEIVAFEPLPASYSLLLRNIRDMTGIRSYNMALGQHAGQADFFVTAGGDASSCLPPNEIYKQNFPDRELTKKIEIEVASLDDVRRQQGLPYADLIKIDTQGFELAVLKGAEDCLKRAKYCIAECSYIPLYEGSALIGEVCHFFAIRGWRIVGVSSQSCDDHGKPLQVDLVFFRGL